MAKIQGYNAHQLSYMLEQLFKHGADALREPPKGHHIVHKIQDNSIRSKFVDLARKSSEADRAEHLALAKSFLQTSTARTGWQGETELASAIVAGILAGLDMSKTGQGWQQLGTTYDAAKTQAARHAAEMKLSA